MLKMTYQTPAAEDDVQTTTDLVLINEKNHPTPLLVGLAAAELAFDALVAVSVFSVMRLFKK